MPLGFERINAKSSVPNRNIVFIKPLPGHDESMSKDYLERIAAQCLPIMNKHHMAVVSLEEYPANPEFWGRNFNFGETLQLVLKSPSTGRWLPFKFVQMVMMHELAHCKQMNHSSAFWKVKNEFSEEMRALWAKGYTGDGLWGRGVLLENGAFAREELEEGEALPSSLCGGTFASRGRKRKSKPKITYKERQERRIKKKFGERGITLGADDEMKAQLENGKRTAGKPTVAKSVRGRELRANAALARFETKKEEPQMKEEDLVTDTDSELDEDVIIKPEPDDAVDINGKRLLDINGCGMVKVCEKEDKDDENAQKELSELQNVYGHDSKSGKAGRTFKIDPASPEISKQPSTMPSKSKGQARDGHKTIAGKSLSAAVESREVFKSTTENHCLDILHVECLVCSAENEPLALTCIACSNVLKPDYVPNSWQCEASTCKSSVYVNSGDVNFCGVCGIRKSSNGRS